MRTRVELCLRSRYGNWNFKRHIMHVSHKPYESVSCNMLWTEIMWGRAWLLTLLNGCRGESILLMPIRRKKLSVQWSFKVSRVYEIQPRCQSPQSHRKLSFDESKKSIPKPRITAGQQRGSALRHIDKSVTGEAKKL